MSRRAVHTKTRHTRAKHAKDIIIREVPAILKSNARAHRGIDAAELIVDPALPSDGVPSSTTTGSPPRIGLWVADTLAAAHRLTIPDPDTPHHHPRVAILNMASPLRPGGGVLTGATSQEEWLCSRTTLYPSLKEEFYRLPEIGGIYTPDVLVFRQWDSEATELPKKDWFFVDVVSAAMLRFPDLEAGEEGGYAEQKDRELVVGKMRAVMRILRSKGAEKVVLGAWGCGGYGNPVGEIAGAWRRVLLGRKGKGGDGMTGGESWDGLEVVFAVKDAKMAASFAESFGPGIEVEEADSSDEESEPAGGEEEDDDEESRPRYGPGF